MYTKGRKTEDKQKRWYTYHYLKIMWFIVTVMIIMYCYHINSSSSWESTSSRCHSNPRTPSLRNTIYTSWKKRSIRLKMIDEAVTNVPRALRVSKKNNTNGFIKAHTLSRPRLVLFTFHLWRHQHGRRRLTSRPLARLVIGTLDGNYTSRGYMASRWGFGTVWHRAACFACRVIAVANVLLEPCFSFLFFPKCWTLIWFFSQGVQSILFYSVFF